MRVEFAYVGDAEILGFNDEVAAPRKGDLVYLRGKAHRVTSVTWNYDPNWPTRVVCRVDPDPFKPKRRIFRTSRWL